MNLIGVSPIYIVYYQRYFLNSIPVSIDLELILPDLFKWYKLFHNDKALDLVNYHITLQHRHWPRRLNTNQSIQTALLFLSFVTTV